MGKESVHGTAVSESLVGLRMGCMNALISHQKRRKSHPRWPIPRQQSTPLLHVLSQYVTSSTTQRGCIKIPYKTQEKKTHPGDDIMAFTKSVIGCGFLYILCGVIFCSPFALSESITRMLARKIVLTGYGTLWVLSFLMWVYYLMSNTARKIIKKPSRQARQPRQTGQIGTQEYRNASRKADGQAHHRGVAVQNAFVLILIEHNLEHHLEHPLTGRCGPARLACL